VTNLDFNTADEQRRFDVIPAGTIVTADMAIVASDDGCYLRKSKDGTSQGLKCEITILEPRQYGKRKVWEWMTIDGQSEGHRQAAGISSSKIRAILESARGIRPDDQSDTAKQARCISDYDDLDGIRFIAKLGVEPARNGYAPRNTIAEVITPERSQWRPVTQVPKQRKSISRAVTPAPIERPA
jgi:hypothetical protein